MLNKLRSFALNKIKQRKERRLIEASGLFDPNFYLANNLDVLESGLDPLNHFLEHGAFEGRAAGPDFDTKTFAEAHPDFDHQRENALLVYLRSVNGSNNPKQLRISAAIETARAEPVGASQIFFCIVIVDNKLNRSMETFNSIFQQSYTSFQIIFVTKNQRETNGSDNKPYLILPTIDAAITASSCDYLILVDSGDILLPHALLKLRNRLNYDSPDILYTDESVQNLTSSEYYYFKPQWSPDLLQSFNYFGRLTAINRSLAVRVQPIADAGPASEWSLNLNISQLAISIKHFPEILCCRVFDEKNDRKILVDNMTKTPKSSRNNLNKIKEQLPISINTNGYSNSVNLITTSVMISVIITLSNYDQNLLNFINCFQNHASNIKAEFIIVAEESIVHTLELSKHERPEFDFKAIECEQRANLSARRNIGASISTGSQLLFIDHSYDFVQGEWLSLLLEMSLEIDIGVVGPQLLMPDGRIQSAGIGLGMLGLESDLFTTARPDDWGSFGSPSVARTVTAVSSGCQLLSKNVFDLVGGYNEELHSSHAGIMLCIHASRFGFRCVYCGHAVLTSHCKPPTDCTKTTDDCLKFALCLRKIGFYEDPFLNKHLDARSSEPRYLKHWPEFGQLDLLGTIERYIGPTDFIQTLDLFDDGAIADHVGVPWDAVTWNFDRRSLGSGARCGARILIEFLRRRPDLRASFPSALSDGNTGGFARWARTEGIRLLGLPASYSECIEAAFEAGFGKRARQFLVYDIRFRAAEPLFLLPNGRAATCRHLLNEIVSKTLTLEEVWWFLLDSAERPLDEICFTWSITPAWQAAVPDAVTIFGYADLIRWISNTFAITSDWLFKPYRPISLSEIKQIQLSYFTRKNWQLHVPGAFRDDAKSLALLPYLTTCESQISSEARRWVGMSDISTLIESHPALGVNILGHFSYPSGLRVSSESMVESLRLNNVSLSLRDVPVRFETDEPMSIPLLGPEIYDITIIHVQPQPLFNDVFERSGLHPRAARTYRIGYWYWEFDEVKADWDRAAFECDEIWTATRFIADGLEARYRKPIRVLSPGIEVPSFEPINRSRYNLPGNTYLFLFAFHMTSVMERKNPIGLMNAFRMAFKSNEDVRLVIKINFSSQHPEAFKELQMVAEKNDVILIDETFSKAEMLGLMSACDAYISLHRSEGLGLSMAEAMLLGKPVIATRYSGNLDFMNDQNSLLVDAKLIRVGKNQPPYDSALYWADPSPEQAAEFMRKLFDDREFGKFLGISAKADLATTMSYRASGARMVARLAEITGVTSTHV